MASVWTGVLTATAVKPADWLILKTITTNPPQLNTEPQNVWQQTGSLNVKRVNSFCGGYGLWACHSKKNQKPTLLTSDMWASMNTGAYVAVNCHYINDESTLLLGC